MFNVFSVDFGRILILRFEIVSMHSNYFNQHNYIMLLVCLSLVLLLNRRVQTNENYNKRF